MLACWTRFRAQFDPRLCHRRQLRTLQQGLILLSGHAPLRSQRAVTVLEAELARSEVILYRTIVVWDLDARLAHHRHCCVFNSLQQLSVRWLEHLGAHSVVFFLAKDGQRCRISWVVVGK